MIVFAADVETDEIAGLHAGVEMVVAEDGGERSGDDAVLSGHGPGPEGNAVGAALPAGVGNGEFDGALRSRQGGRRAFQRGSPGPRILRRRGVRLSSEGLCTFISAETFVVADWSWNAGQRC